MGGEQVRAKGCGGGSNDIAYHNARLGKLQRPRRGPKIICKAEDQPYGPDGGREWMARAWVGAVEMFVVPKRRDRGPDGAAWGNVLGLC